MRSSIRALGFGALSDGSEPRLFILDNGSMRVGVAEYGATLTSALVPAGRGSSVDVLLGFSTLSGYASDQPYMGASVGRFANRIARARFGLGGREYRLAANNGVNALHGGLRGFDKLCWKGEASTVAGDGAVRMTLSSPDGDQGYPGRLELVATFTLRADCALSIRYEAASDAPTPVSLTNHAYFNLRGEGDGDILGHELEIAASRYLPVGDDLIPVTGPLATVGGTPFDFRSRKPIGRDIGAAGGYDHCYALDGWDGSTPTLALAASALEPDSGRALQVYTDMPGIQLYSGNFLSGVAGKRGSVYDKHAGFCLEAEYYPDSPNRPDFPSCVLSPGERYSHTIEYRFGF